MKDMRCGGASVAGQFIYVQGTRTMRKLIAICLLFTFAATLVGCEADAKVDKHGASVDVDKK